MSLPMLLGLAVLTYGSRALALAFLPAAPPWLDRILRRLPASLFAGFAALGVVESDATLTATPVLAAAAGALIVSPTRSLLLVLIGGAAGYAVASLLS